MLLFKRATFFQHTRDTKPTDSPYKRKGRERERERERCSQQRSGGAVLAADFWYTCAPHTDINPEKRGESTVTIWLAWRYRRLTHCKIFANLTGRHHCNS
jgi:hypothetical protein